MCKKISRPRIEKKNKMISKTFFICSFLLIFIQISQQCKILVTSDGLSSSHLMFHYRIAETLAENGFDVTFYHAETNLNVIVKVKYYFYFKGPDDLFIQIQYLYSTCAYVHSICAYLYIMRAYVHRMLCFLKIANDL